MSVELVFIALEHIGQVSHLPSVQIPAVLERIKTLYQEVKNVHPQAQCIFSWHEDSISAVDEETCERKGITPHEKHVLKAGLQKLAEQNQDLHIVGNATVDKPLKSAEDLAKVAKLYPLNYDVRDEERDLNVVPFFLTHEEECLKLAEQGYDQDQCKRVISAYYYHANAYARHDKRYPWKESYNPAVIWQPPKTQHASPFITIEDKKTHTKIPCQLSFCRELAFAKGKTPLLVVMSNHIPVQGQHAKLADVIFQADSHYSALYLTPTFTKQFKVHAYHDDLSQEFKSLNSLQATYLEAQSGLGLRQGKNLASLFASMAVKPNETQRSSALSEKSRVAVKV